MAGHCLDEANTEYICKRQDPPHCRAHVGKWRNICMRSDSEDTIKRKSNSQNKIRTLCDKGCLKQKCQGFWLGFFFTTVPLVCIWIHVSECGLFVLKSLSSLSKAVFWLHSVFCWKDAFSNVNVILPCGSCKEWHNSVCACISSTYLHKKRVIDGWEGRLRDFYCVVPPSFQL